MNFWRILDKSSSLARQEKKAKSIYFRSLNKQDWKRLKVTTKFCMIPSCSITFVNVFNFHYTFCH